MNNIVLDFRHNYARGEQLQAQEAVYQYDTGRILEAYVPETASTFFVHVGFSNDAELSIITTDSVAADTEEGGYQILATIPDSILAAKYGTLCIYIVAADGEDQIVTTYEGAVPVRYKAAAEDYVVPDEEATSIIERATLAATAAEAAQTAAETAQEAAETAAENAMASTPEGYADLVQTVSSLNEDFTELDETVNGSGGGTQDVTSSVTWTEGKSVYYLSGFLVSASSYSYADIPLGDAISISGSSFCSKNEVEKGLCFFDSNMTWISGDYNTGTSDTWTFSYEIPSGAAYLRICCRTEQLSSVFALSLTYETTEGLVDDVATLQSDVADLQAAVENIPSVTTTLTLQQKRDAFTVGEGILNDEYVSVTSDTAPTNIGVEVVGNTRQLIPGWFLTSKYWTGGDTSQYAFLSSSSVPAASSFSDEFDVNQYDKIGTLDDRTITVSTSTSGETAYVLLKFNLIDEYEKRYGTIMTEGTKASWIKKNILNAVICRIYACGSGASGAGITFKQQGNTAATSWEGSATTTSTTPAELRRGLFIDYMTSDGDLYFLVMANSASDGTTASSITIQYVEFMANFKPQYTSVGDHYFALNSHGLTLTVDGTDYTYNLRRGLKGIDGVYDRVYSTDSNTIYERNLALDPFDITGAQTFALENEATGFKTVKVATSIFDGIKTDGAFLLVKRDGFKVKNAQSYAYECAWIADGYLYMTLDNTDTGWIDSMTLNVEDISAYFYGYKMVNSSNGTYDGGTKYYRAIDNMNSPTTTVPTSSRPNWFTPYKIIYELDTAVETTIALTHPTCTIGDAVAVGCGSVIPTINYSMTVSATYHADKADDTAVFSVGEFGNLSEYEDTVSVLDTPSTGDVDVTVNVVKSALRQKFYGVGACITGASAYLLMTNLTATQRHTFLEECFSPESGNFSAIRQQISNSL